MFQTLFSILLLAYLALANSGCLQDFANMPADEIRVNIANRRDKIFLLMEELRRLRIQQRLKVRAASLPCYFRFAVLLPRPFAMQGRLLSGPLHSYCGVLPWSSRRWCRMVN
jgi:hypothetical protein